MKVSIVGSAGIPANYGGFETLVQNLADFQYESPNKFEFVIYCSGRNYSYRSEYYLSSRLRYLPLSANGVSSIPYDIISILLAVFDGSDTILVLGVSGSIILPLIRLLSRKRVITNVDGIEWQRAKWNGFARWFLRLSERWAVCHSDFIIADNAAIASYLECEYGIYPKVIAYGGDHALRVAAKPPLDIDIPSKYAVSVCRIEPENNIHIILEAFSKIPSINLIFVGNWSDCAYGQRLRIKFADYQNIMLIDPIYDLSVLKYLRSNAYLYVHGHSAGGTNPSLVEAMHFELPVLAYDCIYNRMTTEDSCLYFSDSSELEILLRHLDFSDFASIGAKMKSIAQKKYSWSVIARQYFDLLR